MITKITFEFINKIVSEMNKDENKKILNEKFINPLSNSISEKIHPYMMTIFGMYILILILNILVLFILIKKIE